MFKPEKVSVELYDYIEVIDYIESKYKINTCNYYNVKSPLKNFVKKYNEEILSLPVCINGIYFSIKGDKMEEISFVNFKVLQNANHEQFKRYQTWESENPKETIKNFLNWLNTSDFKGAKNGSNVSLNVNKWLSIIPSDDWRHEILELIYSEFNEDIMEFWMEW